MNKPTNSNDFSAMQEGIDAFNNGSLRDWLAGGVPVEDGDAQSFVQALDDRLDAFFEQSTLAAFSQHTPTEAEQIELFYTIGWGEWLSLNTFSLQFSRTEVTNPDHRELRKQLIKQMDDELRHYKLWERALRQVGIDQSLLETDPDEKAGGLVQSFAYFDSAYTDPLLGAVAMQFTDERAPLMFERLVSEADWAIDALREPLLLQVPDEVFHVSIGRDAVRLLAGRGADARNQMLDAITDLMQRFTFPKMVSGAIGKH